MKTKVAVMGPRCQLQTEPLCPLSNHHACRSPCSLSSEPLNVPLCLPTGSKTREGVVQGVASGTSPVLAQPLSLPQPERWLESRGWQGGAVEEGIPKAWEVLHGEGRFWDTSGEGGHLCLLHRGPQPPSPTLSLLQWLRKPRSRHHIWEEPCSPGLGTSQQPQAW